VTDEDLPDIRRWLQPGEEWIELARDTPPGARPWLLGVLRQRGWVTVRTAYFQPERGRWCWSDVPRAVAVRFAKLVLDHFEGVKP
jgi:hypothetical protein